MSFLAGRLAGTEGAFFANQSKIAAARLREKLGDVNASPCPVPSSNDSSKADVLPEILRHSIPLSSGNDTASTMSRHSSLASVSAIVRGNTSSGEQLQLGRHQSPDVLNAMNPLNAWISVPRATFGPKRWTLPAEELSLQASTANEIRKDHSTSIDTEKMKAAMEGFSTREWLSLNWWHVLAGKHLLTEMGVTLRTVQCSDIQREGKAMIQPKVQAVRERFRPLKIWVEKISMRWHLNQKKIEATRAEFSHSLGMSGTNRDVDKNV
ncbi:uncharacterized protein LOC131046742 isoform X2 [Cryptomeria japonica]|uniref:uncharacterized protein LOC131046742 isoform X2 n=1 Tax=Cryptomeria japonica TaxID=3369 RepID=UPI0027DA1C0E|nr:uncharacterized protein LOC131046742 isoform X2 [Cryptomeria japonica]